MIKSKYILHKRNLKQELYHGLVLKKVHRVIKIQQGAWLKPYIDLNTELRKKANNDFKKYFFRLINNNYWKIWKIRENRDKKLVTTERRRSCLVSESNYHATNFFSKSLLAMKLNRT